jgi:hypothetical protein
MMNTRRTILPLAVILSALAFTLPIASESNDHIVINNADEVRETSVSVSQALASTTAGVGPRVVLQCANELRPLGLGTVPGSLQMLLDQVSDRVIVQYANTIREDDLGALPSMLQTLLGQAADRIILQYANANRELPLVYPAALINDRAPPQISDIAASMTGSDSAAISWTTDEFATSTVLYGTLPGVYAQTVSNSLYTRQHRVILTGLTSVSTYYYEVRSADRSGNKTTSSEHSFSTQRCVYLPLVIK